MNWLKKAKKELKRKERKKREKQIKKNDKELKKMAKLAKKDKKKIQKVYDSSIGAEFPIYVFNAKGKRILKIKDLKHLNILGQHLGTVLLAVRDATPHGGNFFSYNKSINQE